MKENLKEIRHIVDDYLILYFKCKRIYDLKKQGILLLGEKNALIDDAGAIKTIEYVDCILQLMHDNYRFFLLNNHNKKNDSNWWMNYYSRSTYFRIMKNAYFEFYHIMNISPDNLDI